MNDWRHIVPFAPPGGDAGELMTSSSLYEYCDRLEREAMALDRDIQVATAAGKYSPENFNNWKSGYSSVMTEIQSYRDSWSPIHSTAGLDKWAIWLQSTAAHFKSVTTLAPTVAPQGPPATPTITGALESTGAAVSHSLSLVSLAAIGVAGVAGFYMLKGKK